MLSQVVAKSPCFAALAAMLFLGSMQANAQTSPAFAVRGRITTSIPSKSIRIVVEDPKAKGASVAETTVDEDGN